MHFYLYGDHKIDNLPASFDFTVAEKTPVLLPAFLLFDMESDSTALIGKICKTTDATFGMTVRVAASRSIQINLTALLNSVLPPDPLPPEYGAGDGRQFVRSWYDHLVELPHDRSQQIVNVILKRNPELGDEAYFEPGGREPDTDAGDDVKRQVSDALYSAFMFFGRREFVSQVTEEGILDFDLNTLFEHKRCVTEDNKHCFFFNDKKLYLHKVHRLALERCLGVDLIYVFMEERRAVFVQYKCTRTDGRYYHRGDSNFSRELNRMKHVPGILPCVNFTEDATSGLRLCRCPVFVKLCNKESGRSGQKLMDSVYFPVCVVERLCQRENPASLTVRDRPHFTNEQFQELVRTGFIGSTPSQSEAINQRLVEMSDDERLKLIFEEVKLPSKGPRRPRADRRLS